MLLAVRPVEKRAYSLQSEYNYNNNVRQDTAVMKLFRLLRMVTVVIVKPHFQI